LDGRIELLRPNRAGWPVVEAHFEAPSLRCDLFFSAVSCASNRP